MTLLPKIRSWFRLRGRRSVKREIDEELRFHFKQPTAENIAAGMAPEEAVREARRRFGNLQAVREDCRELRGASFGETTWRDVCFGLRMLRKNPGFTSVAVFSLAVGMGLNSTVFSLIDQTSLEELPVREPQRVYTITGPTGFFSDQSNFAHLDRQEFLEQCPSFADVVALAGESVVAHYRELPRRLHAKAVSRNYFSFFGLRPALGRFFLEADSAEVQADPVVVISHSLWERDFGRDPGVIGRSIQLDGRMMTVLGVGPRGFVGTYRWAPEDLWIPAEAYHARDPKVLSRRDMAVFSLMARLRADVPVETAQAEAQVVTQRLLQAYPSELRTRSAQLSPLVQRKGARYLLVFAANMLLPGAVLGLACANVSALLIARTQNRTREIATRLVLGSGRGRLVRQMLVESLLLSVMGGAVGLVLSVWTIRAIPSLLPPSTHAVFPDLHVNGHLVLFTVALSVLTTFCFGLWPAWHATRSELAPLLKGDSGIGRTGRRLSGLNRIVIGQLAISLVLLCVAGLFLRSFLHSLRTHPGFGRPDLLLVELNPREYGLEQPQIPAYLRQVCERLQALPGAQRVSAVATVPLEYNSSRQQAVFLPRHEGTGPKPRLSVRCNLVDEHLLGLMNFHLLSGRGFTSSDNESAARVALVGQAAARKYWPDQNPVGQVIRIGDAEGAACEVVGLVADGVYNLSDGQPQPYFFFPISQSSMYGTFTVLVEARVPLRTLFGPAREALRGIDERVLPVGIQTLHESVLTSYAMFGRQFLARLFGLFGVLGLALASIGLYGVIAYAVGRRTREIGIRMAVGATQGTVLRLVLGDGLRLVLIGMALGLPAAFGVAQLLRNGLYGVPPADPLTFVAVPLLLLGVALLACWLPARRAARVNPMEALRWEC